MNLVLLFLISQTVLSSDIITCSDKRPFYFKFFPISFGKLKPEETSTIIGRCFQNIDMTLKEFDDRFEVKFFAKNKTTWLCSELLILTTGKTPKFHLATITGSYKSTWNKNEMSEGEINHIRKVGIRILMSCEDLSAWPESIWMTLKLYIGGMGLNPHIPIFGSKVPEYQLSANLEWIKHTTGFTYERLPQDHFLHIDKHQIKSGTTILIYRFDGIDNIIHVGSGSRSGHCTLTVWDGDELYVVESQNALYWPNFGVQKTRWDEWMKWAHNADYNVVLLPLKDEYQSLFDEKQAWEWFNQLSGNDYGFHNFLYGWLDSSSENLPYFIDLDFISMALEIYQIFRPQDVNLIFIEAFNKRLGTSASNIKDIWEELYTRDMSIYELVAIVEQEGWQYSNGLNYVCSSFVVSMYKKAGLFGVMEINSTEFTPKDLYELDFFDVTGNKVPQECKDHATFGYCQVMGKIRMELGEVSYIKPYDHMNEACPTVAPNYDRRTGC